MNGFRWIRISCMLAIVLGAALSGTPSLSAQETRAAAVNPLIQSIHALPQQASDDQAAEVLLRQVVDYAGARGDARNQAVLAVLHDQADELLGATLSPVNETLRTQLAIPAGQGLLVASIKSDGACARAGLKQNDILLTLAGKPLAAAGDLTKYLRSAGDSAVTLILLRGGKPHPIQVRPLYHVTLSPATDQKAEYFLGISMEPLDDTTRAHLGIPADQGVVINQVVAGSPAEKAGLKKYDVVYEFGGRTIGSPEMLARQVQTIRDKTTIMKVLRSRQPLSIQITATVRTSQADTNHRQEAFRVLMLDAANNQYKSYSEALGDAVARQNTQLGLELFTRSVGQPAGSEDLKQQLRRVEQELKALHSAVDKINEALKAEKPEKKE